MQRTLNGILTLLDSAERLLMNGGDEVVSAGLYTYDFEEYGKLVLLKSCVPSKNGKVEIHEEWFGKGHKSHETKFGAASNLLPDECKNLGGPWYSTAVWYSNEYWYEKNIVSNFEARLSIFYCGLNETYNKVKPIPLVNKNFLKDAMKKLKEIALEATIP